MLTPLAKENSNAATTVLEKASLGFFTSSQMSWWKLCLFVFCFSLSAPALLADNSFDAAPFLPVDCDPPLGAIKSGGNSGPGGNCLGDSRDFVAEPIDPAYSYTWDLGQDALPATASGGSVAILTYLSPGLKTVTLTIFNGVCTTVQTTEVWVLGEAPTLGFTGGGCSGQPISITGIEVVDNLTYSWTGPDSYTSSDPQPTITNPGVYTLALDFGICQFTSDVTIPDDAGAGFTVAATGGSIACGQSDIQLMGSTTATGPTYSWTGPGGFTSSQQNPTVSAAGTYTLTVSDASGCSASDSAVVTAASGGPSVTATGGALTCEAGTITIMAIGTPASVSYSWTGPGGFTSSQQNPMVSTVGTYTVTVSDASGCTAQATATVTQTAGDLDASATGGALSCDTGDTQLMGSSTASGVSYSWTGPGGFTSIQQNPLVTTVGSYTLTVSNGACSGTATATVTSSPGGPTVNATGGEITCANSSVTLMASSAPSNVTYSWTGPGGFTSTQQNPSASAVGTYTVTAEDTNGCTGTASAQVTAATGGPSLAATADDLTCEKPETTLMASSTTTGLDYSWSGPGGFTSTQQNPTATATGTYTVIGTDASGCQGSAEVTVEIVLSEIDASATGGEIDCNNEMIALSGSSTVTDVTYSWTGPGGFTSTQQNPMVGTAGTYTLTVSNSVGCTGTATATVTENTTEPNATATGGELDCNTPEVTISGNSSTTGATYSWTGASNFTSTMQNPTVSTPGNYVLTVTDPSNGCTAEATALVTLNQTTFGVVLSPQGNILDCNNPTMLILGSGTINGLTWSWVGPGGFTSTNPSITVSAGGTYTATVTETSTGCFAVYNVEIAENFTEPNASAIGGEMNCANDMTVTIQGSSTTTGATYSWSGPGNFSSTEPSVEVSTEGTYTLTVENPENGCTATADAVVTDAMETVPSALAEVDGVLSCTNEEVMLIGSSDGTNVTYSWTGPAEFAGDEQNPTVTEAGTYILTVTDPETTCGSPDQVTVMVNTTTIGVASVSVQGFLNCDSETAILIVASSTPNLAWQWSGPNGFDTTEQNPTITEGGTYTVVGSDPVSGCSTSSSLTVTEDLDPPGITAEGGVLSCGATELSLMSDSPTAGVNYEWTGPGGFTSTDQNPTASAEGDYTVTAKGTNGCTSSATVSIVNTGPEPTVEVTGGTLTCDNPSVQLMSSVTGSGLVLVWTGPGSYSNTTANPTITVGGTYTLTITDEFDCTAMASTEVLDQITEPTAVATGGLINCNTTEVQLMGSTDVTGMDFSWTGPMGFSSTDQNPTTSTAGTYTFTVTDPTSNCSTEATATVTEDSAIPSVTATGGTLTCGETQLSLMASSTTAGVSYLWTGPSNFSTTHQNPLATVSGTYTVTVTADNGCTNTATATIENTGAAADVNVQGGTISCLSPDFFLNAIATGDVVSYSWTGPNGFTSDQEDITVTTGGSYTVSVLDANGCADSAAAEVVDSSNPPSAEATGDNLTCLNPNTDLMASSDGTGVTFEWTLPDGSSSSGQSLFVTVGGTYTVTVTDPSSGCSSETTVEVTENLSTPELTATGGEIACGENITISASSTTANVSFAWVGPNGFTSSIPSPEISIQGLYTVTASDLFGCEETETVSVVSLGNPPSVTALGGSLNCVTPSVTLQATSNTANLTFAWTGPNGFTSTIQNPNVSVAGNYIVQVTDSNGCIGSNETEVLDEGGGPVLEVTSDDITCSISEAELSVSSETNNLNFLWEGPDSFTTTQPSFITTTAGTYTVTATDPSNGCVSQTTVEVDYLVLDIQISITDGSFSCATGNATIGAMAQAVGASYSWVGPGGFSSTNQNPEVTSAGIYTVTVSDINGCTGTGTANVTGDGNGPNAEATATQITCDSPLATLIGESTNTDVSFSWSGPNGFSSTLQNAITGTGGLYTLTVTETATGCQSTDDVNVPENTDAPSAQASGGDLGCGEGTVTLEASSNQLGVSYQWSGPAGFTSTEQNPVVSVAGTYNLTVTDLSGCDGATQIEINEVENTVTVVVDDATITCETPEVSLTATSNVANAQYSWSGPIGFVANGATISTTLPGLFTVTATDPATGCSNSEMTEISLGNDLPFVEIMGEHLSCSKTSAQLTGTSLSNPGAPELQFFWAGPDGFYSEEINPVVTEPGAYVLTVLDENTGCSNQAFFTVLYQSFLGTNEITGGVLNCNNTSVQLTVSSTSNNLSYSWTGPNNFSSNAQNVTVTEAGNYIVELTNLTNGCSEALNTTVNQNINPPAFGLLANDVSCENPTGTVSVNYNGSIAISVEWTGPNGFTSSELSNDVTVAGTYSATVTNPINGCTQTKSIELVSNGNLGELSISGSHITCDIPMVQLMAITNGTGTFSWTGPQGFTSSQPNVLVSTPGTYHVELTDGQCNASSSFEVLNMSNPPQLMTTGGELNCGSPMVTLTAAPQNPNVGFSWTGPNGFTSNVQNPTVNVAGEYTVTALNMMTGCSSTESATVTSIGTEVEFSVNAENISCTNLDGLLSVTAAANLQIVWSGPNNFNSTLASVAPTGPGTYTVTVTDPATSCQGMEMVEITGAIDFEVNAIGGMINCDNSSLQLVAMSNLSNATYSWTGPNGFSSNQQNPTVSAAGNYEVTVVEMNCTGSATATVMVDETVPQLQVSTSNLGCAKSTATVAASSTTAGLTFSWSGPDNFTANGASIEVSEPGQYLATGTDATNGCEVVGIAIVNVVGDLPDFTVQPATLTCGNGGTTLSASSAIAGLLYDWSGPNNFSSTGGSVTVNAAGQYYVTATNPTNSCSNSTTVLVSESTGGPTVTTSSASLNCALEGGSVSATSSANNSSFAWTGPAGFTSNGGTAQVNQVGTYTVTVTDNGTGCTSNQSVDVVVEDFDFSITANSENIGCDGSGTISVDSATSGVIYSWTGPNGYTSTATSTQVTMVGTYDVIGTHLESGCTNTSSVTVTEEINTLEVTVNSTAINCDGTGGSVTAVAIGQGLTYSWSGPESFSTQDANSTVTTAGFYTVTVTDNQGCSATGSIAVASINNDLTIAINASTINCDGTGGAVGVTSNSQNLTYSWTGPQGFSSQAASASVSNDGLYTVTVTNTLTNCIQTASVAVVENDPTLQVSSSSTNIDCDGNGGSISASSAIANASYSWTGPNGFSSSNANAVVSNAGFYNLLVTNTATGCTASLSETVTQLECAETFDLALSTEMTSAQDEEVYPGEEVSFAIRVSNEGTAPVYDIMVIDYLPMGFSVATDGWNNGPFVGSSVHIITGELEPGSSTEMTLTLVADMIMSVGEYCNSTEIYQAQDSNGVAFNDIDSTPDSNPSNDGPTNNTEDDFDSSCFEVIANPSFDLSLNKTLAPGNSSVVSAGDLVSYLIIVSNDGNETADDVSVVDYLPEGTTLASGNWTGANGQADYTFPQSIPGGTTAIIQITLEIGDDFEDGETIVNNAEISAAYRPDGSLAMDIDSNPDNDPNNDGSQEDDRDDASITFSAPEICEINLPSIQVPNSSCLGEAVLIDIDAPIQLPVGYEHLYILTSVGDMNIQAVSTIPLFNGLEEGNYTAHLLAYHSDELDPTDYSNAGDLITELLPYGGTVCGALIVDGPQFNVVDCNTEPDCEDVHMTGLCVAPVVPTIICPEVCEGYEIEGMQSTFECSLTLVDGVCFKYTALPGFAGTEFLTIEYCNDDGHCINAYVTIEVGSCDDNDHPNAVHDNEETNENEPVLIDFFDNDYDPDGDQITLCLDFDDLKPDHGEVEITEAGFIYTPDAGFTGNDSFTYTICDEEGLSDQTTVYIEVIGTETCEGVEMSLCVAPVDPTVICPDVCDGYAIVDMQTTFDCSLWLVGDDCFQYTALPGFTGTEMVQVEYCNDDNDCFTTTVTIVVSGNCDDEEEEEEEEDDNHIPNAVHDDVETNEGESIEIDILANDYDPDGDEISLCLDADEDLMPENGTVVITSEGVIYTPNPGFIGDDNFTYTLCDEHGLSDQTNVNIEVIGTCEAYGGSYCAEPVELVEICIDWCGDNLGIDDVEHTYDCSLQYTDDNCFFYRALPGFYGEEFLTVTGCDDNGNCEEVVVSLTITDDCGSIQKPEESIQLDFPTVVSANQDGMNDLFVLLNKNELNSANMEAKILLKVFTAAGQMVYETEDLLMDGDWNPSDANLPRGTYFYIYEMSNNVSSNKKSSTGKGFFELRK